MDNLDNVKKNDLKSINKRIRENQKKGFFKKIINNIFYDKKRTLIITSIFITVTFLIIYLINSDPNKSRLGYDVSDIVFTFVGNDYDAGVIEKHFTKPLDKLNRINDEKENCEIVAFKYTNADDFVKQGLEDDFMKINNIYLAQALYTPSQPLIFFEKNIYESLKKDFGVKFTDLSELTDGKIKEDKVLIKDTVLKDEVDKMEGAIDNMYVALIDITETANANYYETVLYYKEMLYKAEEIMKKLVK